MAHPLIGVTCSSGDGVTQPVATVGQRYLDGIVAAGGLPVVLPSLDAGRAAEAVAAVDGLLLTGGGDVDPARYGAVPEPECGPPDTARDAWELALVAEARRADIPILGICRGAQVLAVATGGTLVQHLPGRQHDDLERAAGEVHQVAVEPDTLLHGIVGVGAVRANTLHHQAVRSVGPGLIVSGRTDDGVIEAIEAPGEAILGVQWHPELLLDRPQHQALFDWLVDPGR
jgi:putative glutamine amidotransferase